MQSPYLAYIIGMAISSEAAITGRGGEGGIAPLAGDIEEPSVCARSSSAPNEDDVLAGKGNSGSGVSGVGAGEVEMHCAGALRCQLLVCCGRCSCCWCW